MCRVKILSKFPAVKQVSDVEKLSPSSEALAFRLSLVTPKVLMKNKRENIFERPFKFSISFIGPAVNVAKLLMLRSLSEPFRKILLLNDVT